VVRFLHRIGAKLAFFVTAENRLDGRAGLAGKTDGFEA
jgi:hypothetical protein